MYDTYIYIRMFSDIPNVLNLGDGDLLALGLPQSWQFGRAVASVSMSFGESLLKNLAEVPIFVGAMHLDAKPHFNMASQRRPTRC